MTLNRKMSVFILAGWLVYLTVCSLFYFTGGDGPSYHYGLQLMLDGKIPVIDFFALQPPGFFLPYYAVGKLFSPTWEAMRFVSLFSFVTTSLIVVGLVRRHYAPALSAVAFVIMGFSHFWFYWNATIIHYSISNLTLLLAFVAVHSLRPNRRAALLAGLAAGWCVDSRLTMGPVTLLIFYQVLQRYRSQHAGADWREAVWVVGLPFMAGGIIGASPGIALFILDPAASYLELLNLRSAFAAETVFLGKTHWEQFLTVLQRRLWNVYSFFFWIDASQKAQIGNTIVLVVAAAGAIGAAISRPGTRLAAVADFKNDRIVRSSALIAGGVLLTHALTIFPAPYYAQAMFPFLVILALAAVHYGYRNAALPAYRTVALTVIGLALVPYTLYFMAWTGGSLIRRNEPSSARPVTMAMVGCWLEKNTAPDAKILSYAGLPVSAAHRRMPDGWTYPPFQVAALGALDIPPAKARAARILTREEFLDLFREKKIAAFVEDRGPEGDFASFVALAPAIAENYKLATETGGAFPFKIYVPADRWRVDLPQLPPQPELKITVQRIREASVRTLISELWVDLAGSLAALPADLKIAFARVTDAPFDERCGSYLVLGGRPKIKI